MIVCDREIADIYSRIPETVKFNNYFDAAVALSSIQNEIERKGSINVFDFVRIVNYRLPLFLSEYDTNRCWTDISDFSIRYVKDEETGEYICTLYAKKPNN